MLKKVISGARSTISAIVSGVEKIGSGVLVAMMLLIATDITLRRVFNSPLPFSFEVLEVLLVVVAYCYVAYTTSIGRHVSINVLVSRFSPRAEKSCTIVADFITVILFGMVGWQSIVQGLHVQEFGTTTALLEIPKSPFVFTVAFGCILACLVLLVKVLHSIIEGTAE